MILCGFGLQARGQAIDCAQLQQQIAQADRGGNRYAAAARRQAAELARTQAYAHQLGCDGFSFFGGNPQCGALNSRIGQMQANLGQLQSAGGGSRGDLVARFNAYCRGQPQAPRSRGFLESLFGGAQEEPRPGPLPEVPPAGQQPGAASEGGAAAHGGSQAVCVRSCDGGFFPLGISARRGSESLTEMCQALCPGTETAVFTRSPDSDIKSAVGLDGKPYMDLPNALKFQKNYSSACSCRQPGKSWAETLANAEEVLGSTRKGDIVVTPEKSAEMSRPKLDPKARASLLDPAAADVAPATKVAPADAAKLAGVAAAPAAGPGDGAKRPVRQVGPQP